MLRIIFINLFIISSLIVNAQNYTSAKIDFFSLAGMKDSSIIFNENKSSIGIELSEAFAENNLLIEDENGNTYPVIFDSHDEKGVFSELIIFDKPINKIKIKNQLLNDIKIALHLIYVKPIQINYAPLKQNTLCPEPEFIPASVWRSGLPAPTGNRTIHRALHNIIHHSAGSNTDTNYTQTVRNIYIYHSQTQGYDDIGYNYVVAPNGQIYQGRDPQGLAPTDEIFGAHFCAKNTGTMGICYLGNLNLVKPDPRAVNAIVDIIAYKISKEQLDPYSFAKHPLTDPNAGNLNYISGHRDGCATECPGDSLYLLIPKIKDSVYHKISNCPLLNVEKEIKGKYIIFPNPNNGEFELRGMNDQEFLIMSIEGKIIQRVKQGKIKIEKAGIYFLLDENKQVIGKIVVRAF